MHINVSLHTLLTLSQLSLYTPYLFQNICPSFSLHPSLYVSFSPLLHPSLSHHEDDDEHDDGDGDDDDEDKDDDTNGDEDDDDYNDGDDDNDDDDVDDDVDADY